jgi:hypothetical protein
MSKHTIKVKNLNKCKIIKSFDPREKTEMEIKNFLRELICKYSGIKMMHLDLRPNHTSYGRLDERHVKFSSKSYAKNEPTPEELADAIQKFPEYGITFDDLLSDYFPHYGIRFVNSGPELEYLKGATQALINRIQIPTWRLLFSSYTLKAISTVGLTYAAFTLGASVIGLTVAGLAGFMFNKLMFAHFEAYRVPHYLHPNYKDSFLKNFFYTTTRQAMEDSAFMIAPTKSGINRFTTLKPNQASSLTNLRALGFDLLAGISSALTLTYAAVPLALTRVAIAALPAATLSIIACKGPSFYQPFFQPKDGSSETPTLKHAR